jgi:hypothetical protein
MGEEIGVRPDEPLAARDAHDRRTHLKRLGLGVAAAGAWVTPQVVGAPRASAGCTPVLRRMQFDPGSCSSEMPNDLSCLPANWFSATNASFGFSCSSSDIKEGGSITISETGCTPVSAVAEQYCPGESGEKTTCVTGSISGNTVTFPTTNSTLGCVYLTIRIVISCCT